MLFSEPKIPQSATPTARDVPSPGFSALQRAENSSIRRKRRVSGAHSVRFQCSSASRKFLNVNPTSPRFASVMFQCSSASRKFLNQAPNVESSALVGVSVLFSEPKIPQRSPSRTTSFRLLSFSALQRAENSSTQPRREKRDERPSFSALQRAENSSTDGGLIRWWCAIKFQCSSASRKFLNLFYCICEAYNRWSFSALQRAENSSTWTLLDTASGRMSFSALQRAENSSTAHRRGAELGVGEFQCSSASRKFLNTGAGARSSPGRRSFSALQRAENSSTCVGFCEAYA